MRTLSKVIIDLKIFNETRKTHFALNLLRNLLREKIKTKAFSQCKNYLSKVNTHFRIYA